MARNCSHARGPSQTTTPWQQSDPVNLPFDMAKLVDEPLFTESFPYCCLALRDVAETVRIPAWLKKYDLSTMSSDIYGVIHVHSAVRREDEHKRQAVCLFIAAIDWLLQGGCGRICLFEVGRLHESMARAIGIDASSYTADGRLKPLLESDSSVTLDAAVTLHLRQAGFLLPDGVDSVRLSRAEVGAIAQDLVHEAVMRKEIACNAH